MTEDTTQKNTGVPSVPVEEKTAGPREGAGVSRGGSRRTGGERGGGDRRGGRARGGRPGKGGPRGGERARPEFDNKLIQIRRVTRVVAGGRRFAFSVAMVAGNRKGSVGVGVGKAADTATAIEKAMKNAKKNMIKIRLSNEMMIPHHVEAKLSSARVMIMPAPGRGMVAGSAVRNVLDLAGVRNVRAKIISGSKNKLNIARASVKALGQLRAKRPKIVA